MAAAVVVVVVVVADGGGCPVSYDVRSPIFLSEVLTP
jgi:hypothetical protein